MKGRIGHYGLVVALLLLLSVGIGVSAHAVKAGASTNTVALTSVSAPVLAVGGLSLTQPAGTADVTKDSATGTVLNAFPGANVREVVLATVAQTRVPSVNGCLCWIISIVPRGGIWSSGGRAGRIPLDYDLEFVDAKSGAWIFGTRGTT